MLRWPAEWESQLCCFVGWPDHESQWLRFLEPARESTAALVRALGDQAVVCVANSDLKTVSRRCGNASVLAATYGDIWMRDTGPVWRVESGRRVAVGFRWTGWGGSYLLEGDDRVCAQLADLQEATVATSPIALEGGGLETDGQGTCLTTRDCLLNDNRNPGKTAEDLERELATVLGVSRVVWVDKGLANDHTDGHIDNLARFVRPGVVALAVSQRGDPNYEVHGEVREAVESAGLEIAPLPSPGRIEGDASSLLPASYLNFVIANEVVCVPTFEAHTDDQALKAIEALFPGRRVVGVNGLPLLYGGGALHCMTNHVPAL